MNLYEIDNAINEQLDIIFNSVNEDGEITVSMDTLEELKVERATKLENIACYIKNLKADVVKFKNEEDNLKYRRQILENRVNRLEKYLADHFATDEKFESPRAKLSYRKSYKVSILDEASIPKKYLKVKTDIDKVAIKHAIDEGKTVKGAEVVENYSLQIK